MAREQIFWKMKIVFFVGVISGLMGCAALDDHTKYHKQYYDGEARLRLGMTMDEVKAVLGEAIGFHRRQISRDELREIWVYHVKTKDPRTRHFYPDTNLIVFSNGKLVAKNPRNPMGPAVRMVRDRNIPSP